MHRSEVLPQISKSLTFYFEIVVFIVFIKVRKSAMKTYAFNTWLIYPNRQQRQIFNQGHCNLPRMFMIWIFPRACPEQAIKWAFIQLGTRWNHMFCIVAWHYLSQCLILTCVLNYCTKTLHGHEPKMKRHRISKCGEFYSSENANCT